MKKIVMLLFATVVMCALLAACGDQPEPTAIPTTQSTTAESQAHVHAFAKWKNLFNPSVDGYGKEQLICGVCKEVIEERYIPPTGSLGLNYEVTSRLLKTCVITGIGSCTDTRLYIGSYIDGYKVTGIAEAAFVGNLHLTEVVILDGLTTIGDSAFSCCTNLSKLTIADSVETIELGAFMICGLTEVKMGSGIRNMAERVFNGCWRLADIVIPEGITYIENEMFDDCFGLKSVTIPVSVTKIEYGVFASCVNLQDIYFAGTMAQWEAIEKEEIRLNPSQGCTIHCTDGDLEYQE